MSVNITDYRLALIGIIAIALIIILASVMIVKKVWIKGIIIAITGIFALGPSLSYFFKSFGANDELSIFLSSLIWIIIVIAALISMSIEKDNKEPKETEAEANELKEKTEIFAKELLEKCKDISIIGVATDFENKKAIIKVENIVYGEGFLQENRETIDNLVKKHYGSDWGFEIEEFECQVFTK